MGNLKLVHKDYSMELGTIVRIRSNINNYPEKHGIRYEYGYYKLCFGSFKIGCEDCGEWEVEGNHFVCLGHTYFHGFKDSIAGVAILDDWYEIVKEVTISELH